ncbi:hypothetical protein, conserved [Eimeria maxima]|uniref:Uncharacterized protein n=1 Tax=Eimeria maxima TaxID=5804 RepID=U6M5G3_EIMMA|nr:hypothetical protein, conserved [Eimeria maxima]CDJ58303.1 hypothetical protein, conserved [Eimeria maxima]
MRMQVELCLLQLQRGGTLTVLPYLIEQQQLLQLQHRHVIESAAACGAPANALASAAVDLLEGIRSKVKQHQQLLQQEEEELAVSSLLQELPQVPAATLGLLRWSESRAEVLQQLQQLQQQEQQAAAGAATPFSLVVASDVLYSDRSARLLACTIKSIAAAAATGAAAVGPSRCSAPSFLCLISHQVRHAVYLEQQQVVKEAADSCLQTFIREFCPTKEDNRTSFASLYAAKPLRQQQQPLTAAAEPAAAAAAATAGVPPAAGSAGELYVHLITTRPAAAAATAELELREGDVCLVAIAADPQQLLQLPPAVAPAGAAMLQAL